MDDATRKEVEANSTAYYDSTAYDNAEDTMPTLGSDNGLTLADLTGKAYDDPMWDQLLDQMSFEDMSLLVNLGGWQTAQIDSVGKVATSDVTDLPELTTSLQELMEHHIRQKY